MTFRNPLTSLPADAITSGTFSGSYVNAGQFTLAGNPAGSHVQASPTALIFYAADGVTPLISMDTAGGAGSISSSSISGGTINGTAVTGGTVTGSTIQTAASGKRLLLSSSGTPDSVLGYSGVAGELNPGALQISASSGARGPGGRAPANGGLTQLLAPDLGGSSSLGVPALLVMSQDPTHTSTSLNGIGLLADWVQLNRGAGASSILANENVQTASGSTSIPAGGTAQLSQAITYPRNLGRLPDFLWTTCGRFGTTLTITGAINQTAAGFTLLMQCYNGATMASGTLFWGYFAVWLPA